MHTFPTSRQACPAFFGPNTGTDIINMSDNWLAHVIPTLLAQPNVTVLITWDEGVEGQGEHITTLLAGAGVTRARPTARCTITTASRPACTSTSASAWRPAWARQLRRCRSRARQDAQ